MTTVLDYQRQDLDRYYRSSHELDSFPFSILKEIPKPANIILFGCGRGEALKYWINGIGIDFNPRLEKLWESLGILARCEIKDSSEIIEYVDNYFDYSVSCDFLEHLAPEKISKTLVNIFRLAPKGIHIIDMTSESGFRGLNGRTLHPSANDLVWWTEMLKKYKTEISIQKINNFCVVKW